MHPTYGEHRLQSAAELSHASKTSGVRFRRLSRIAGEF